MSLHLPRPIELFMSSENTHDTSALEACFTLDATVRDEGGTREGLKDIAEWRRETARKYQHTVTPIAIAERKGKTVVTAKLTGNFPGTPVTLDFVFKLEGDRITSLEIQPQAAI
jgi:hypothetical protein